MEEEEREQKREEKRRQFFRDMVKNYGVEMESLDWATWYREEEEQERREREEGQENERKRKEEEERKKRIETEREREREGKMRAAAERASKRQRETKSVLCADCRRGLSMGRGRAGLCQGQCAQAERRRCGVDGHVSLRGHGTVGGVRSDEQFKNGLREECGLRQSMRSGCAGVDGTRGRRRGGLETSPGVCDVEDQVE